jgi:tetratricopeptide (TPR) repeat protein
MKIDQLYADIIREADNAYDNKVYHLAISEYQDALNVKNKNYPKDQTLKINRIMQVQPRQDNLKRFAQTVARGDEYVAIKDYKKALTIYKLSLTIQCFETEEDSIREKLKAIEKLKE